MAKLLDIAGLSENTTPVFRWELYRQASEAGLDPSKVAAVMRLESNFDPNIQNKGGAPALGLIQFWESNFPGVVAVAAKRDPSFKGTRWEDLRTMSAVRQLPLVMAYFEGKKLTPQSTATDYYMAVFLPAFIGRPRDFVLGRNGSTELLYGKVTKGKLYEQNAGLDADGNGTLTIGDVSARMNNIMGAAMSRPPLDVYPPSELPPGVAQVSPVSPVDGYAWVLLPVAFFLPQHGSDGARALEPICPICGATVIHGA